MVAQNVQIQQVPGQNQVSDDKLLRHQIVIVGGGTAGITVAAQLTVARYNGYTSCPVVTGYGTMVLAEFDYDGIPAESFPFNQAKERWSMWLFKRYFLPLMYWKGMLKGRV